MIIVCYIYALFVVKSTSVLKSQANFVNVKSLIGPIPKIPS